MSFNLLLISLPKLRIKAPASQSLYNTTSVDCRQHKSHTILKNRKLSTSGGNGGIGKVKVSRAHGFVPSRVSLRPARARRSCGHFGTVSVRSTLPPLCVPVSPSPVSREASGDLWRSIGPSTMVEFKLRPSKSAHPLCPKYNIQFNIHVHVQNNFIFPTFQTRRDSSDGCF